jgi:iron(III) transport system ATP-binding protein
MVGLLALADRPATQLSGGQQQRVALARAVVNRPKLLLLDEPLSNLDAALRQEMRRELKKLQSSVGVTTVYVTHDQVEALEMSDQIAVMRAGRIVQLAPSRQIYERPANAFVASFVGNSNRLEGVAKGSAGEQAVAIAVDGLDGQLFARASGDIAPGARCLVAVRPEAMTLRAPSEVPEPRHNRVAGTIAFAGFVGGSIRYEVRAGRATIEVYDASSAHWAIGDAVAIDFAVDRTLAFPDS